MWSWYTRTYLRTNASSMVFPIFRSCADIIFWFLRNFCLLTAVRSSRSFSTSKLIPITFPQSSKAILGFVLAFPTSRALCASRIIVGMFKYIIKNLHKSIQTSLDSMKLLFVSEAGITDLSKKYKKKCKFLWICGWKIIISNRVSNPNYDQVWRENQLVTLIFYNLAKKHNRSL